VTDIEMESQTRESAYAIWEDVEHWLAAEAICQPVARAKARRVRSSASEGGAAKRPVRKTATRKPKTGAGTPRAAP